MNERSGKRVAIIVTDGFEQIELTSPREALAKAGDAIRIDKKAQQFVQEIDRAGKPINREMAALFTAAAKTEKTDDLEVRAS